MPILASKEVYAHRRGTNETISNLCWAARALAVERTASIAASLITRCNCAAEQRNTCRSKTWGLKGVQSELRSVPCARAMLGAKRM